MCNRARNRSEPETLFERFGAGWLTGVAQPNRDPVELAPRANAYIVRQHDGRRGVDVMGCDVLGGKGPWPMTIVRQLGLPQWRRLARDPE